MESICKRKHPRGRDKTSGKFTVAPRCRKRVSNLTQKSPFLCECNIEQGGRYCSIFPFCEKEIGLFATPQELILPVSMSICTSGDRTRGARIEQLIFWLKMFAKNSQDRNFLASSAQKLGPPHFFMFAARSIEAPDTTACQSQIVATIIPQCRKRGNKSQLKTASFQILK